MPRRRFLLGALAGVLGIALVVVLVIVFMGGGSKSSGVTGTTLPDSDVIAQQFRGFRSRATCWARRAHP